MHIIRYLYLLTVFTAICIQSITAAATSIPSNNNDDTTGRYIVVLKPNIDTIAITNHIQHVQSFRTNSSIIQKTSIKYGHAFNNTNNTFSNSTNDQESSSSYSSIGSLRWYAGEFYSAAFESSLPTDASVHYWVKDVPLSLQELVQKDPPSWGLDRIDQRIGQNGQYRFPTNQGAGVDVYILDTGVKGDHEELEGRVRYGPSFVYDGETNDANADEHGHGTFVAGVCCSTSYGVAKQANIVSVKTLDNDGNGMLSDLLKGLSWVVSQHRNDTKTVVNLSLGADFNQVANDAIAQAVSLGIHVVVAAGNYGEDACKYSPGSAPQAITVGAIDQDDAIAYYSNFGKCVDIFAPGTNIVSTWNTGMDASKKLTGTSMAAPHVSGALALMLAKKAYTPAEMQQYLKNVSSLVTENFDIDDMGNSNKTVLDNAINSGWKSTRYNASGTNANILFTHPTDGEQLWVFGTSKTSDAKRALPCSLVVMLSIMIGWSCLW
ncbi:subtilisin-like protein [Lichtheimia hyalospora FSU 10163]|nr:subtilisin-like protein [Lichtheimia hyalospora FSU 10163]